jgi:hypothetical protein
MVASPSSKSGDYGGVRAADDKQLLRQSVAACRREHRQRTALLGAPPTGNARGKRAEHGFAERGGLFVTTLGDYHAQMLAKSELLMP